MSESTLEELLQVRIPSVRALAREIIALREVVWTNGERVSEIRRQTNDRLVALEAAVSTWLEHSESLFARVTAVEADRETREPRSYPPTQAGWDTAMANMGALQRRAEAAERERDEALEKLTQNLREHYPLAFDMVCRERDAAIARAEQAERERGEAQAHRRSASEEARSNAYIASALRTERDEARAERDAAVEALKRLASTEAFEGAMDIRSATASALCREIYARGKFAQAALDGMKP